MQENEISNYFKFNYVEDVKSIPIKIERAIDKINRNIMPVYIRVVIDWNIGDKIEMKISVLR